MSWWQQLLSWLFKQTCKPVDPRKGPLCFYGPVNHWMLLSDTELDNWMRACKDANLAGGSIEMWGNDELGWVTKPHIIKAKYETLILAAQRHGRQLYVTVVNWNSSTLVNQGDDWFKQCIGWIKSMGPGNQIVEPLSEWLGARNRSADLDAKANRWNMYAQEALPAKDWVLGWNKGSRPASLPSNCAWLDWHSANMNQQGPTTVAPQHIMLSTDHSIILAQMQPGGVKGPCFDPAKVQAWISQHRPSGRSFNLYGYYHKAVDYAAIRAAGKAMNG